MAINFVAGQEVTADDLNALAPLYINKSSDESVTNSVVMQNDNDFVLSFGAGQTWIVELYVEFQSVSATPDVQMDWLVSGGLTIPSRHFLGVPAGETDVSASTAVALQVRDDTSDVSAAVVTSTTSRASIREVLKMTTTTAGTATFRWAQNTANASATVMKANTSFLIAHRVS